MIPQTGQPVEWNADAYHRVSKPQIAWGQQVIRQFNLAGNETVIDAGCGSGQLTAELLQHLPHGRCIAVDQSANMLAKAEASLRPRFGDRVSFLQADIQRLTVQTPVDLVFSTATFHWVPDHQALFTSLFRCLKPGGRLIAQCGGGANIARLRGQARALLESPAFRGKTAGWRDPWTFATAEETARRLAVAGFTEIATNIQHEPTPFPDAEAFREFVTSAVLVSHLDAISDDPARNDFIDRIVDLSAREDPPFLLDYWRLNMSATRPIDT